MSTGLSGQICGPQPGDDKKMATFAYHISNLRNENGQSPGALRSGLVQESCYPGPIRVIGFIDREHLASDEEVCMEHHGHAEHKPTAARSEEGKLVLQIRDF